MVFLELFIVLILGLVLGSFATALIYRVPRDLSWAFGTGKHVDKSMTAHRSACPYCSKILRPIDLMPVVSWALAKGQCRHCKEKIAVWYPLTELAVVLACVGSYLTFGFSTEAIFIIAAIPFMAALLVIDLQYKILPDQLVIIAGGIALLRLALEVLVFKSMSVSSFGFEYLLGGVVFAFLAGALRWAMGKALKKEAMGLGDVKFFAVAGLWLGLSNLPAFCIISGGLGVILAVFWQVFKKQEVFPFGPALILTLYGLLLVDSSFFL